MAEPLLEIEGLRVEFDTRDGVATVIDGLDISLYPVEILGIVGESGCGKSVTCHAILQLTPPNGRIVSGEILFEGRDLLALDEDMMGAVRGRDITMIFQDPLSSLNPVHTIGAQLAESLILHQGIRRGTAHKEASGLLERVGIADAGRRLKEYPHQLSGGQRQRVMIAMALSCAPDILLADEPTTALDVTIQGQILDLINELVDDTGMALILISHDLGVISEAVDDVAIMYGGTVVEQGSTESLFTHLAHPYSQGLFAAVPRPGEAREGSLATIPGIVPELFDLPLGCAFADRCFKASDICRRQMPGMELIGLDHQVACHHHEGVPAQ